MLRLIILFFIIYLTIRLVMGLGRWLRALSAAKPRRPAPSNPNVIDEMKPCAYCGTYVPTTLSLAKKELYFCSEQCHVAFLKRERA